MRERRIFLIRHAKPYSDGKRRYLGQTDPSLSPEGINQAELAADTLKNYSIACIYTSDLLRASQTADIIAKKLNIPVKKTGELREINMGEWENLTFEEVRLKYPDEFEKRGKDIAHYRPPGGENFTDLQKRAMTVFNDIVQNSSGDLLIVGHAGVNRVILCGFMNISLENIFTIKQDYASVFTIVIKGNTISVHDDIYPQQV